MIVIVGAVLIVIEQCLGRALAGQSNRDVLIDRLLQVAIALGRTLADLNFHIHDMLLHGSDQHAKRLREDRREKNRRAKRGYPSSEVYA
ncbi:hypothetical protein GGD83_004051 [Rhodoblastus sphagnicola]|uniref:hypothetical protein n=1 Tax=Rhodoblastus sphagnicola TaxID=333368 RepID=UPI00161FF80D|nr:hypothetical protein [Rhodoblastus sphagnicola]MBB4200223.1 hypothetical protein [Rhodoblastus sphagnicola]